jgi:hypothetical protein
MTFLKLFPRERLYLDERLAIAQVRADFFVNLLLVCTGERNLKDGAVRVGCGWMTFVGSTSTPKHSTLCSSEWILNRLLIIGLSSFGSDSPR